MRTLTVIAGLMFATHLAAQEPIADNSFLIEEAYNQDPGVVQHIQTFTRATRGGDWLYTFTQEWPVGSMRHQLSYTLPVQQVGGKREVGDIALNYRYQLAGDGGGRTAIAPRLTLLVPTGGDSAAVQAMLPISTTLSPSFVAHWNVGATVGGNDSRALTAGQSIVWLPRQRFNALLEMLWTRTSDRSGHETQTVISPGVRWSYDLPRHLQIVPGIAFPITHPGGEKAVLLYLSFEHPY
jgi:hypothetical protein